MTIPQAKLKFKDGGLGIVAPGAGLIALIGVCSDGEEESVIPISSEDDVVTLLGYGPLTGAAHQHLAVSGQPILAVPCAASIDGEVSSVTQDGDGASVMTTSGNSAVTRTGTGTATAALSGTATQFVDLVVEVLENGANLASTPSLKISTDGGLTFGAPFDLASNGVKVITGTGLTITFAEGTFVDGDLYTARAAYSNPVDDAEVIIEITADADDLSDDPAFRYSLDGGDTYSQPIAVPASGIYQIPHSGLSIKFTNASFVDGDTYSFTATAKAFDLTDITDAIDVLLLDSRIGQVEFIHIVGVSDATIAAGVAAKMDTAETSFKYLWALLSVRDIEDGETEADWITAQNEDFDGYEEPRTSVVAGYVELIDPVLNNIKRRPFAWAYAARLASIEISQNPLETDIGPLDNVTDLYHDENKVEGLDAARFVTARTWDGETGFHVTRGNMMSAADSDFYSVMNRRVIDAAARVARSRLIKEMGKRIKVSKTTGKILETEARRIEGSIQGAMQTALSSQASGFIALLDRQENVLSTKHITVKISVVPFGYIEGIDGTIGYTNPSLSLSLA